MLSLWTGTKPRFRFGLHREDVSRLSFYFGWDNVGVQADPNIHRIHQKKTVYRYGCGRLCLRKRETGGEMNLTVSFEDGATLSLISGKAPTDRPDVPFQLPPRNSERTAELKEAPT